MDLMKPPNPLSLVGNLAENWRRWRQRFEFFLTASGISEKSAAIQASTLLHVIGEDALDIYNSFTWDSSADSTKLDKIMEKFEAHCNPRKNVTFERHIFNTRNQQHGENIDTYVTDLRNKAKTCEFGDLHDSLIRDRIVCGIQNDQVRARLLRQTDLTLEKAVEIGRAAEVCEIQAKSLTQSDLATVDAFKSSRENRDKVQRNRHQSCPNCGGSHRSNERCPASGVTCYNCERKNHFARVCRSSRNSARTTVHTAHTIHSSANRDNSDDIFIGTVTTLGSSKEWFVEMHANDKRLSFKIDTGAECNLMSSATYETITTQPLERSRVKLHVFGGRQLNPTGKATITCEYQGRFFPIVFQVVSQPVPNILGLEACTALYLVQRVLGIDQQEDQNTSLPLTRKKVLNDYQDVFYGLGCVTDYTYHIETDPSVKPVVHPPRGIPVAIRSKVQAELQRMEKLGVIERVHEPTEWVNSLVTVVKPNGKIRLCMDPKDLNSAIQRAHYPMKTIEDVLSRLPNAKIFSKLDATQGFWQIQLDDESAKKCTFNTPFGCFRFHRLPFGLSSAPEVFQNVMSQIFDGLDGVEIIVDDLLVWGATQEEHDAHLQQALECARQRGIKLNPDKCEIGLDTVTYIGHTLTSSGLQPDPKKIEAISSMDQPTDRASLQRFMGMVTYLAKFIPNFSHVAGPLRTLLEKDVPWHWQTEQESSFQTLKLAVTNAPVLKYFDVKQDVLLQVDASPNGLGAVLLQDNRPVAYASRSLSRAEQNYAHIEKEMLAITFGCERFHEYVYGKKNVTIHSDHKPLESILRKPLYHTPQRLQKMILRLQKYSLHVEYKPGKEMLIADTLSRACSASSPEKVDDAFEVNSIQTLPMSKEKVTEFQEATKQDPHLQELLHCVQNGWPCARSQVPLGAKPYWNYRDEISQYDGLLFKGDKVLIPSSLRPQMLKLIHGAHLGIEKCRRRARDVLFWPGMNSNIDDIVNSCTTCQEHQKSHPQEPLQPHDVPNRPWAKIAADLFEFNGANYLLLVDYYSGFFEIAKLNTTSSDMVITQCKSQFARYGIPDVFISDNGPQFASGAFRRFRVTYGFTHITSSPNYPQSNGLAEKSVQTAKRLLQKALSDGQDPYLALLDFRNAPRDAVLGSPVQRLMGRRTKTLLPTAKNLLQPKLIKPQTVQHRLQAKRQEQKNYYDQHCKSLPELQPGDAVFVQTGDKHRRRATVVNKAKEPRSYTLRMSNSQIVRRNRRHLYKTANKEDQHWLENSASLADDESDIEQDDAQQRQDDGVYRTLSGRVVRQPQRYGH